MSYGSVLRAKLDPDHPTNKIFGSRRVVPSDETIEKQYRIKLYGSTLKPIVCTSCHIALPRSGSCQYC